VASGACTPQACSATSPGSDVPFGLLTCTAESVSLAPAFAPVSLAPVSLAPVTAPVPSKAPVVGPPAATIQVVFYNNNRTCTGAIVNALIVSTGVCVSITPVGGNSAIYTKTGNTVSVQGYADNTCQTPGNTGSFPLNTCTNQIGQAILVYAYPANTLPPSPFTTTTGQVTQTQA